MIPLALVGVPIVAGAVAWAYRPAAPVLLLAVSLFAAAGATTFALNALQAGDPTSRLFLGLIDLVFLGIAAHVVNAAGRHSTLDVPRFTALALPFLGFANLAVLADNVLLGWCAVELTTLLAVPMIVDDRSMGKRTAAWQYFLFSTVGLTIVLVGAVCLQRGVGEAGELTYARLGASAALGNPWSQLGLSLMVAGYGTKLGLVPMNTWLPLTYAAAPAPVTALLGAVQFNCVMIGLLRVVPLADGGLVSTELLWLGLLTMAASTIGIVTTRDYLRLLGYASVNHAGVIAVGLGIGGVASYGVVIYVVSNAFIKAILFLTAGRVHERFGTTRAPEVHGLIKVLPYSGVFLMVGTFALLGLPPFGSFVGELLILSAIVESGHAALLFPFCALLAISFVATGRTLFPMIWGEPMTSEDPGPTHRMTDRLPKAMFLVALVGLGLYVPAPLHTLLDDVAVALGGP